MRKLLTIVALVLFLIAPAFAESIKEEHYRAFLIALRMKETPGYALDQKIPAGDGGQSIGPLQIKRACWQDSGVKAPYAACEQIDVAFDVARGYFKRYAPSAVEEENWVLLARLWNGGPNWKSKESTLGYAIDVESNYDRLLKMPKSQRERVLRTGKW